MSFQLGRMTDGASRIEKDFRDFAHRWAEVKESWRDSRRDQFEQQHLAALSGSLSRLAAGMQKFCESVENANRDLEDPAPLPREPAS